MIPRYNPYFSLKEIFKYLLNPNISLESVEEIFAKKANAKYALFLPYGRSSYYFLLKAYNIENEEVIIPAYTCPTLITPILASNNIPVFVDAAKNNFNMDHSKISNVLSTKTRMIITSSMWGTPIELDSLVQLKRNNLFLVGDFALGLFNYLDKQKEALNILDLVFFSFGLGKELSFLGGGMAATNNAELYKRLKMIRDKECKSPKFNQVIKKIFTLALSKVIFKKIVYRYFMFLSDNTKLLNKFKENTESPYLPKDFFILPTNLQLFLANHRIQKIHQFISERKAALNIYYSNFSENKNLQLYKLDLASQLPLFCHEIETSKVQKHLLDNNVYSKTVFKTSLPSICGQNSTKFPNANKYTRQLTMLPIYFGIKENDIMKIVNCINDLKL